MHLFYETAIAVRNSLDKEDPLYTLKKDILSKIVASIFFNEEEFDLLYIYYEHRKYLLPPSQIIEIVDEFLSKIGISYLKFNKKMSSKTQLFFTK